MQRPTPAKVPRIEADAPASALGLLDDCHGRDKDVVGEAAPARPGDGPFDGQECPVVRARLLRALYPNHPTDAFQRRTPLEAALPSLPPAQAAFPATSYYKSAPLRTWRSPGQVLPPHPLYDYSQWAPPTPGAKLFARPQEVYEGGACEEEMEVEAGPQGEVPRGLKRPCAGSLPQPSSPLPAAPRALWCG